MLQGAFKFLPLPAAPGPGGAAPARLSAALARCLPRGLLAASTARPFAAETRRPSAPRSSHFPCPQPAPAILPPFAAVLTEQAKLRRMRPYNFSLDAPIEPRGRRGAYSSQAFADPALDASLPRVRARPPAQAPASFPGGQPADLGPAIMVLHTQIMSELSRLSTRVAASDQAFAQRTDSLEGSLRHTVGIGIDSLRARVDALRQEFQGEARAIRSSLSDRLDAVEGSLGELSARLDAVCSALERTNALLEKGGDTQLDPQKLGLPAPTPVGTLLADQTSLARLDESVIAAERRILDASVSL